ncbi:molybdopterin molybdotransferase MoeA [Croceicoccus mobilis]|uniref:Molybdopterin molybdenumtransferase n=1 Tax=Croceicoccus mobilis TaxID=1703339 RepID=A0A916Z4Y6_9SPHN|nr:molybdopterin molybdotransferase MoeA [Croceicoccus mobilis]GGD76305.1 molybdopterin molybdenumtransferase MoeA [Croceicoccus mobilis]
MKPLLGLDEAQARLLALATPLPEVSLPIEQAAGRWLARDLLALRTQPPQPMSAMDGWAVRQADMPGPWAIIGESAAGHPFPGTVGAGEAVRIATGGVVPAGTDMVAVQEDCRRDGDTLHFEGEPPRPLDRHIRPRGLDFSEGAMVARAGERLTPARLALAITAGHGSAPVRETAHVTVIEGGDELRAPGEALQPGAIPASNGAMLAALFGDLGCKVTRRGPVPDRREALRAAFEEATASQLIVTSGGASVGDHDLVLPVLEEMGAEIDFWRVAIKPGKPLLVAKLGNATVIGLPGNPVSSFVTAHLFAMPFARALMGDAAPLPALQPAFLMADLPATGRRSEFLRAEFTSEGVMPIRLQDSGALSPLAAADALVFRLANSPAAKAGDVVRVLPLAPRNRS